MAQDENNNWLRHVDTQEEMTEESWRERFEESPVAGFDDFESWRDDRLRAV